MGHVATNYSQDVFQGLEDDAALANATPKAALNTNWTQNIDENFRVYFEINDSSGSESTPQFKLQYQVNGGGYFDVATVTAARVAISPHYADDDQVNLNYYGEEGDNLIPTSGAFNFTSLIGFKGQLEACLQLYSAHVVNGDIINLRVVHSSGTLLDSYPFTLSITATGGASDTTPPAIPTDVVATPGNAEVVLTWTDPPDADLFSIDIYNTDGPPVFIGSVSAGVQTYTDTGLTNGDSYFYSLVAVDNNSNESNFSAEVSAIPTASGTTLNLLLENLDTSVATLTIVVTQSHNLTVESVSATCEVPQIQVITNSILTISSLEGFVEVQNLVLEYNVGLSPPSLVAGVEFTGVSITQEAAVNPADISASGEIVAVGVTQAHILTATNVQATEEASSAILSQCYALTGPALTTNPTITSVSLDVGTVNLTLTADTVSVSEEVQGVAIVGNSSVIIEDAFSVEQVINSVVISSAQNLIVENVTTAVEAFDVGLIGAGDLAPTDLILTVEVNSITIEQRASLSVSGASVNAEVDSVAISESITLVLSSLGAAAEIDSVMLEGMGSLVIESITLVVEITDITLTGSGAVTIENTQFDSSSDSVTITQNHELIVESIATGESVDVVTTSLTKQLVLGEVEFNEAIDDSTLTQHHMIAIESASVGFVLPDVGTSASRFLLIENVSTMTGLGKATFNLMGEVNRARVEDGLRMYGVEFVNELYDIEDVNTVNGVDGGEHAYAILDAGKTFGIEDASD